MTKPLFSGRIPPDLHQRVEERRKITGESKTDILVGALAKFLDFPLDYLDPEEIKALGEGIKDLKERFEKLESLVEEKFKALEEKVERLRLSKSLPDRPLQKQDDIFYDLSDFLKRV